MFYNLTGYQNFYNNNVNKTIPMIILELISFLNNQGHKATNYYSVTKENVSYLVITFENINVITDFINRTNNESLIIFSRDHVMIYNNQYIIELNKLLQFTNLLKECYMEL